MHCDFCTTHMNDVEEVTLPTLAEASNPGVLGVDTGYEFTSPKTNRKTRVIAKQGEPRDEAIARVRANHGL